MTASKSKTPESHALARVFPDCPSLALRANVFVMRETWLKPNRRAILFACVPQLVFAAVGAWVALGASGSLVRWIGAALAAVAGFMIVALLAQLRQPRIAYGDGQMLLYLQSGPPIAVPVRVVEAFFLAQGPAQLPGRNQNAQQAVNLVVRLAQRETEWARRDVKPALGNWCDGYITIRGTWCEPLDSEVVRRLNRRLKEVTADKANADKQ